MIPPGWFFNRTAELDAVAYPQDKAGGEVPTASATAILVPCCVQQDAGPTPAGDGQRRRGSEAGVRIFFRPADGPGLGAVAALKVNDRLRVSGLPLPLVLDGPPFDASGRGVVWECRARDVR